MIKSRVYSFVVLFSGQCVGRVWWLEGGSRYPESDEL
jgi:hypothetical protein